MIMKQKLSYALLLAWLLPAVASYAESRNVLYIPPTYFEPWTETLVPVCVENTCDTITGIQFTMSLPEGMKAELNAGDTTNRLPGHHVAVHANGSSNSWTVMAYSDDNTVMKGVRGAVFYLKCKITDTGGLNDFDILMNDSVLSDIKGKNVITDDGAGRRKQIICAFDSLEVRPSVITHLLKVGETVNGSCTVTNRSSRNLTSLSATADGTSEFCDFSFAVSQTTIRANESVALNYSLTGTKVSQGWERMIVNVRTAEGVQTVFPIQYRVYDVDQPLPKLKAERVPINVKIPVGTTKPYEVILKNEGNGETGPIKVSIPDGSPIKAAMSLPLKSIAPGDSAKLMLEIKAPEGAVPNVPLNGEMGVNPEKGSGIKIPYTVTPVEEKKGRLTIDVVDDFTKAAENGPHVSGAKVRVLQPASREVVAEGLTASDGTLTFKDLDGGLYSIEASAERHKSRVVDVFVNAGQDNKEEIYLELPAVDVTFTVEEDPVNDTYVATLKSTLEVDIPAPNIDIELPESKPLPNTYFPITATNNSTTTAFNVEFGILTNAGGSPEFRSNPRLDELKPGQVHTFFVRLTAETLPDVLTVKCVSNYTYALSGETRKGSAWCQKTYGSDKPQAVSTSSGGYTGTIPFGDGGLNDEVTGGQTTYYQTLKGSSGSNSKARVGLKIEQDILMTRQAFLCTLTAKNNDTEQLEDIVLNLVVTNHETGEVAAKDAFDMKLEDIRNFSGEKNLGEKWILAAAKEGVATIRFVPTDKAAPEKPVEYDFGGTLTYRFANMSQSLTNSLMPVTKVVNPTPVLHLNYFLPRQIMGDDLLTPDVKENSEPAELVLLVTNTGHGDAQNFSLVTHSPQVIDNKDHLPIEIQLVDTWLNGEEVSYIGIGEIATELGTIPAGGSKYAQWAFISSLKGNFVEYNVSVEHLSPYSSLIADDAKVHELNKSISLPDGLAAFLANDDKDDDQWPEKLYFTDGTEAPVNKGNVALSGGNARGVASQYQIRLTADKKGWAYGRMDDPSPDLELAEAVRNKDGVKTSAWRTMEPVEDVDGIHYKRVLHIVDNLSDDSETYTLNYADMLSVDHPRDKKEWSILLNRSAKTLWLDGEWNRVKSLLIVDCAGRQWPVAGSRDKGISISCLHAGLYVLKIITDDGACSSIKFQL